MIESAGGVLAIVLRFVALTATTGTLGAWAVSRLVATRFDAEGNTAPRLAMRTLARHAALWCLAMLALSAFARLSLPVASVPDAVSGAVGGAAGLAAIGTPWGKALLAQGIVAAVTFAVLLRSAPVRAWPLAGECGVALLAFIPPFLAHAGSASELRAAAVFVDLLHGAAAGGWVGALAIVTIAAARADAPARAIAILGAFHPVAVIAAPTVFVTGLITAWLRMGVPVGIASPTYSGLFVAKLLLVGITGFIGAGHSKLATRKVPVAALGAVRRTLAAECAFALLVLVITAVLVGTAPIG